MCDYGVPMHLEPNVLQELVMPPAKISSIVGNIIGKSQVNAELPAGALGAAPWRRDGVQYANNEVYLDITERLDATVDGRSSLLRRAEVRGEVECNCALSGRPDLTLSFHEAQFLDDCAFHPCVRLNRWERERVVSFIPPDGKFILFTYRVRGITSAPIYVNPQISWPPASSSDPGRSGGRVVGKLTVTVGARHAGGRQVDGVNVSLSLPRGASSSLRANVGSVSPPPDPFQVAGDQPRPRGRCSTTRWDPPPRGTWAGYQRRRRRR